MTKWEYLREAIGADDLNARGDEGWELVSVAAGVMFYKRPVDPSWKSWLEGGQTAAPAVEPVEPVVEPVAEPPAPPEPTEPQTPSPEPVDQPDSGDGGSDTVVEPKPLQSAEPTA